MWEPHAVSKHRASSLSCWSPELALLSSSSRACPQLRTEASPQSRHLGTLACLPRDCHGALSGSFPRGTEHAHLPLTCKGHGRTGTDTALMLAL